MFEAVGENKSLPVKAHDLFAGSDRRAGGPLARLSSYPVRAQQEAPSLCQFNSNQPTFTSHCSRLFVNQAGVRCHIRASKACFTADLCFKEIHDSMFMLGPATSWQGRDAWLVLHLTYVINLQVKQ
jgi:hypothetical protein